MALTVGLEHALRSLMTYGESIEYLGLLCDAFDVLLIGIIGTSEIAMNKKRCQFPSVHRMFTTEG